MDAENPPIARSDDGRSFLVGDATGTTLVAGSLVVVSGSGERQLALVEERTETQPARLRGRLIGVLAEGRLDTARSHPFEAGTVEEVDAATIEVLHATTGALLEVGRDLTPPGGPSTPPAATGSIVTRSGAGRVGPGRRTHWGGAGAIIRETGCRW